VSTQDQKFSINRRQLLLLGLSLVAVYVVIPQIGNFRHSLPLIPQANFADLWLALLCTVATYVTAAGTYWFLALHRLSYARTALVQVAGMFVNRLLPAGIGGMGVNYAYLRRSKHTATEAASVVTVNNVFGTVGHGLLLAVLLVLYHQALPQLQLWQVRDNAQLIILVTIAVLIVWAILYRRYGKRLQQGLRGFLKQLLAYRHRPLYLSAALVSSMLLTLSNVLGLWFCVAAMHADISFMALFLVFSFGIALGAATPTPGGLGGVEAGLVAGLVACNIDEAVALAIVLIYRLLTYWLPLLVGAVAFIFSQHKRYI
jgi:uncharacterized membrane protein YbhN (UPF0104 family)